MVIVLGERHLPAVPWGHRRGECEVGDQETPFFGGPNTFSQVGPPDFGPGPTRLWIWFTPNISKLSLFDVEAVCVDQYSLLL